MVQEEAPGMQSHWQEPGLQNRRPPSRHHRSIGADDDHTEQLSSLGF